MIEFPTPLAVAFIVWVTDTLYRALNGFRLQLLATRVIFDQNSVKSLLIKARHWPKDSSALSLKQVRGTTRMSPKDLNS